MSFPKKVLTQFNEVQQFQGRTFPSVILQNQADHPVSHLVADSIDEPIREIINKEFKKRDEEERMFQKKIMLQMETEQQIIIQKEVKLIEQKIMFQQQHRKLQNQSKIEKLEGFVKTLQKQLELNKVQAIETKISQEERNKKLEDRLEQVMKQNSMLRLKLSNKIVSNRQQQLPQVFQVIQCQVEAFSQQSLLRSQLLFHSNIHNQNISHYLRDEQGKPFPIAVIFFAKNGTTFGIFSDGVAIENSEQKQGKAFLFNASQETKFIAKQTEEFINPLSFTCNSLVAGNRQLILKNNMLGMLKVHCSNIMGRELFKVVRRQILTGEDSGQVQLQGVELHRFWLGKDV